MSATNGNGRPGTTLLTAQVDAAERLARAIVFAFDVCDEDGVPLSQVQKVAIIEAALLEFDGHQAHLCSLASLDGVFRGLRRDGERNSAPPRA